MTICKAFYVRRRNGGPSSRLIQTFLREGVFYYLLISIANLVCPYLSPVLPLLTHDTTILIRSMAFSTSSEYQIRRYRIFFSFDVKASPSHVCDKYPSECNAKPCAGLPSRMLPLVLELLANRPYRLRSLLRFLTSVSVAPRLWHTPMALHLIRMDPGVYRSEFSLASNVLRLAQASAEPPVASLVRMAARVLPSTPVRY